MQRLIIMAALLAGAAGAQGAEPPAGLTAASRTAEALELSRAGVAQGAVDLLRDARPAPTDGACAERQWLMAKSVWLVDNPVATDALLGYLAANPAAADAAEARMLLGDNELAAGRWASALDYYNQLPPEPFAGENANRLRLHKGIALLMLGRDAEASALLERVKPGSAMYQPALFYRAYMLLSGNGDADEAERLLRRVDPAAGAPCCQAPFYLAQLEFRKEDYSAALADAQALLANPSQAQLSPAQQAECMRIAGESSYALGNRAQATSLLWEYLSAIDMEELGPAAANACYILGVDEYDKGNTTAAIKLMQRAVGSTDGPTMQSAYLYLGQAYRQRGDNDAALMAFEQAVRNNYNRDIEEQAYYNSMVTRIDGGRVPFKSGLAMMEDFLEAFPQSAHAPAVSQYLVEGYMNGNDYERALTFIDNMPGRRNEATEQARRRALTMLGSRDLMAGNPARARQRLEEASKGTQADAQLAALTRLWLAESRAAMGDAAGAAEAYKAFLNMPGAEGRNRAVALYGLGYTQLDDEKYAQAARSFADAEAALPADAAPGWRADIANRRGDALQQQRRWADAMKAYVAAENHSPATADYAIYSQAIVAGLQGRHADKVATIDRLLAAFPATPLAAKALLEKAESQLALGKTKEAMVTYRQLIEAYPSTEAGRNGYLQLALTELSAGNAAQAEATYKKVIELYPSSPEAALALDDLKRLAASQGKLPQLGEWLAGVSGAPQLNPDEMERLSFEAAEDELARKADPTLLRVHLQQYASGPHAAMAWTLLAEDAWEHNNASAAIESAGKALAAAPDGGRTAERALLVKGEAESAQGKWNAARQTYTALASRASDAVTLRSARMGLLRASDRLNLADEALAQASLLSASSAAANPDDDKELQLLYARALMRKGRKTEGRNLLRTLAADPSAAEGAEAAVMLAQSLLADGDTKGAKAVADAFIDANPPQQYWLARGFIVYSDILRAEGSDFEADEYLKSLRSNYPGSEADIREMIKERLK